MSRGAQPSEAQPPEAQPPETQPPETQPPEAQPPEAQPPETQPPEAQPPEAQPPEAQPPKAQPSAGQSPERPSEDARAPGPQAAAADSQTFTWRRVAGLFAAHRARVALIAVVALTTSIVGILNPLLIQAIFDTALFGEGGVDTDRVVLLGGGMVLVSVLSGSMALYQNLLTNRLGQSVLSELRVAVFEHLHSLSLSFFTSARTGEIQSRISNDVGGIQVAITSTLSQTLSRLVTVLAAAGAMLLLSWQLTLLSMVAMPAFIWATRRVGRRRRELSTQVQEMTAEMNIITSETLSMSGFTLSRLFGRADHEIERFTDTNEELAELAVRRQIVGQSFFTVVGTFMGATPVLVYVAAGIALSSGGDITAGTIVAFTTLQGRMFLPLTRLFESSVQIQSSRALFERIFDYLDLEPDLVEAENPVVLSRGHARGRVEFDGVHFAYQGAEELGPAVLEGVSFTAERGQMIAFVGASGSGKTTVSNLVPRMYDPTRGSISIDGHPLPDLSFDTLADLIGMVTQESYLFAGTLGENIAYPRPDASQQEIQRAARAAAIHKRILEFPDGYDTLVGERGVRLSGGERQRIAMARVLLHDPPILVLDEATSALDSASERKIQDALAGLVEGRTTIAIAHRLSTIAGADTICVMDQGRIVERGTHAELLAADGEYRKLYDHQFHEELVLDDAAPETAAAPAPVPPAAAERRSTVSQTG